MTKATKLGYNMLMIILTILMLIFSPQLRLLTLSYAVMFIVVELYAEGIDRPKVSLLKAVKMVLMGFIIGVAITKFGGVETVPYGFSFLTGLAFFKIVSYNEEAIFRVMLPKYIGIIASTILYTIIHFALISTLTQSWEVATGYLLLTFGFGILMYFIYKTFNSFGLIDGIHWGFDVAKMGLI